MGLFSRFTKKRASKNSEQQNNAVGQAVIDQQPASWPAPAAQQPASKTPLLSPLAGQLVALESTGDKLFSERALGDGVAIVPAEGELCAPVSGTVEALFPTAHALAIIADDGTTHVMLHIGIDTVEMAGDGFAARVAQGDHVAQGQILVSFDLDKIAAAGYDATTFVVVCERCEGSELTERAPGPVAVGDQILWLS